MKSISVIRSALIVWVVSYVFFLLSLVSNFSASHDSINYLDNIVKGEHLFHQHHLLYHFLAHHWLHFVQGIIPSVPAHFAIESFTALWGSSVLAMVWLFFRNRFHLMLLPAALGTAIVACSYGVWFYSVNIEVYMPPLFFIVCSLYLLTGKNWDNHKIWQVSLLHSLAILFHQVNILFALVVVFVIVTTGKHVFRSMLQYALAGIAVTGGAYFLIGWFAEGHNTLTDWMHWMQGYTIGHDYWQSLSIKTPLHVATGFIHAFIGGHYIFRLPAVEHYLQESFRSHGLKDEIFLSSGISASVSWILTILSVLLGLLLLTMVVRFLRKYRTLKKGYQQVVSPLLLCLAIYSLFFCFWMPEILEFWILQMVLVWLLLIGTLPAVPLIFRIPLRTGLMAVCIMLFTINYAGSMKWLQDIHKDWYYEEVQRVKAVLQPGDLVLVEDGWIIKYYFRYYTSATVVSSDEPDYKSGSTFQLKNRILSQNGRVFVYNNGELTQSY